MATTREKVPPPSDIKNEKLTEVRYGTQNVLDTELQFFSKSNEKIDTCMNYTRPQLAIEIEQIKKAFIDAKNRGVRLRYLTEITKENISFCKELMNIVDELRHLDGIKGNFMLSESEYLAPLILFIKGEIAPQIFYSNIKQVIEHQQYVFDTLWVKAVSAAEKIKEIEEGLEPEFFDVITDRERVCRIFIDLASSAKKEMLALLPNDKSMVRLERLGVIDHMIRASQNGAIIKIICPPLDEINSNITKKISDNAPNIRILNDNDLPYGMYLYNKKFLRAELKVPNADNISESVEFATYSNSKTSVESSKSVFELLWNERMINEELKMTEKMQIEFIDIAARELMSTVQAILALSKIVQSDKRSNIKEENQKLVRDVIVRKEERAKLLTKNIFDVIEIFKSHSLQLNKERFDLNEEIRNVINDIKSQARFNSVSIIFEPKQDVFVEADKVRIYEVISNLLKTAIQWTKEDSITIVAAEEEKVDYNGIRVSITGKGIDPEIWEDWRPRLFRKFATEYVVDTGFGLFISKSIIEAHGGKIWAENNADGKGGATFVFTIPLQAGGKAS